MIKIVKKKAILYSLLVAIIIVVSTGMLICDRDIINASKFSEGKVTEKKSKEENYIEDCEEDYEEENYIEDCEEDYEEENYIEDCEEDYEEENYIEDCEEDYEEDYIEDYEEENYVEDYSLQSLSLKYDAYVENYGKKEVQITNLETNKSETIEAVDELEMGNCINRIYWVTDTILAVEEHVNPSLSALVVIDAETNSILYSKYGVGFTWTEEDPNSLLYVKPAPHFSNISGSEKICNVEDDKLLETGKNEQIVSFDISETDNSIAYVVNDKKDKDTVYIADYNKKKEKLVTKDAIKMDTNQDYYSWNEEGQLVGTVNNEEQVIDGGK